VFRWHYWSFTRATSVSVSGRFPILLQAAYVESWWYVMAHGDAREGKWRGNWRMECVASTLHTTSDHGVSSITTADAHTSAASSRLNWRPLADLNGPVRFAERRNLVSARVPSHFNRPVPSICLSGTAVGVEVEQNTVGWVIYSFGTAGVRTRKVERALETAAKCHMRSHRTELCAYIQALSAFILEIFNSYQAN